MAKETLVGSLTSDFRAKASPEDIAERRKVKAATKLRNIANQRAIAQWHNESRGKMTEVPFPERRKS